MKRTSYFVLFVLCLTLGTFAYYWLKSVPPLPLYLFINHDRKIDQEMEQRLRFEDVLMPVWFYVSNGDRRDQNSESKPEERGRKSTAAGGIEDEGGSCPYKSQWKRLAKGCCFLSI